MNLHPEFLIAAFMLASITETGGGASVGESVKTSGNFVGRDSISYGKTEDRFNTIDLQFLFHDIQELKELKQMMNNMILAMLVLFILGAVLTASMIRITDKLENRISSLERTINYLITRNQNGQPYFKP